MTKYAAIPTVYKGVRFRSRLEARWACMFDMLGWNWLYEPFDLSGYIPDFLIDNIDQMIVEVKPIDDINSDEWDIAHNKMLKAGVVNKIGVVGSKIWSWREATGDNEPYNQSVIGKFSMVLFGDRSSLEACSLQKCATCGAYSIFMVCPVNGCKQVGYEGSLTNHASIKLLWNQAANLTQWKGQ